MVVNRPMRSQTMEPRRSARRRLLDAADELFYAEGVQTVGIDRIIDKAGVAKASLYNSFSGKEELVAAYLGERSDRIRARVTAAIDATDDPRAKILAVFDSQAQVSASAGYHGCAFIAAATEAPQGGLVDVMTKDQRGWVRALFTDLAGAAGAREPGLLGEQLQLVYDGVSISVRMDADATVTAAARGAVEMLLNAHC
jgi:AcrR family transcriptional regulator